MHSDWAQRKTRYETEVQHASRNGTQRQYMETHPEPSSIPATVIYVQDPFQKYVDMLLPATMCAVLCVYILGDGMYDVGYDIPSDVILVTVLV